MDVVREHAGCGCERRRSRTGRGGGRRFTMLNPNEEEEYGIYFVLLQNIQEIESLQTHPGCLDQSSVTSGTIKHSLQYSEAGFNKSSLKDSGALEVLVLKER